MKGLENVELKELYVGYVNSMKLWTNGPNVIVGAHIGVQTVVSCEERWSFQSTDTEWLGSHAQDVKHCNVVLDLSAKLGKIVPSEESDASLLVSGKMVFIQKVPDLEVKAPLLHAVVEQTAKGLIAFNTTGTLKIKPQAGAQPYYKAKERAIFYVDCPSSHVSQVPLPSKEDMGSMPLNVLSAEEFISKFF